MEQPKVAVLFGFGINCDHETAAVFNLVGGDAERVHVNHFISGDRSMEEFHILAVPGGFSFGDHLGSCLLYTSPSPRDATLSRMPSSA